MSLYRVQLRSKDLKVGFVLNWIVGATGQKKLLKLLALSFGLVRNSSLLSRIIFEDSDILAFKEINDLVSK